MSKLLKMDIQLFAEEGAGTDSGAGPEGAQSQPGATSESQGGPSSFEDADTMFRNMLESEEPSQEPAQPAISPEAPVTGKQTQQTPPATTETADFDVDKFIMELQDKIISGMAITDPAPEDLPGEQGEATPPIEFNKDDFFDKFYADPQEALKEYASSFGLLTPEQASEIALKEINTYKESTEKQLMEVEKWTSIADQFKEQYPDYKNYWNEMNQVLEDNPYLKSDEKVFEKAYKLAKADKGMYSASDVLNNQSMLQELMKNEKLIGPIVESYLRGIDNNQQPITISGLEGNTQFTRPHEKPRTIEEADAYLKQQLNL